MINKKEVSYRKIIYRITWKKLSLIQQSISYYFHFKELPWSNTTKTFNRSKHVPLDHKNIL